MMSASLVLLAILMVFNLSIHSKNPKVSYGFAVFDEITLNISNILLAVIIFELMVREH